MKPKAGKQHAAEHEPRVVVGMRRHYLRTLNWSLAHPVPVFVVSVVFLAVAVIIAPFLGSEFVPRLDEGDISITAIRLPGVALSETVAATTRVEKVVRRFPEVITTVSRSGSPEISTDVMGIEVSDVFVILKPRSEWKTAKTKDGLIEKMEHALNKEVPGSGFSFTQPIEMRFNELIAGVKSDVAVKIFGDDLDRLRVEGQEIERILAHIPGAADVKLEQTAGLPFVRIIVDRERAARYGIPVRHVLDTVEALRAGRVTGAVFEGQRRFPLTIRFDDASADSVESIRSIPVSGENGTFIPLGQVAEVRLETGSSQISREAVRRRIVVEANVRGRDVGSFVKEADARIRDAVKLPEGYYLQWGGQFENLRAATRRLLIVVPLALALIFVMLFLTFDEMKPAMLIYMNVPFAGIGGVFALALRGMPFSISAAVGFIAVFGVAVLNAIVLVTAMRELQAESNRPLIEIVRDACASRMRAVVMTPLVAALGFVPMALSHGLGAEVQRPLATVVIGGVITSTLLTLLVLPTLFLIIERRGRARDVEYVPELTPAGESA